MIAGCHISILNSIVISRYGLEFNTYAVIFIQLPYDNIQSTSHFDILVVMSKYTQVVRNMTCND